MRLIEEWRGNLDKKMIVGGVLMDLSKAFDTVNRNILTEKLRQLNFNELSIELLESYMTDIV